MISDELIVSANCRLDHLGSRGNTVSESFDLFVCACGYRVTAESVPECCPECSEPSWSIDLAVRLENERREGRRLRPPKAPSDLVIPPVRELDQRLLTELHDLREHYAKNWKKVSASAKGAVTERRFSKTRMISPEPLFAELDRDQEPWRFVKRNWLDEGSLEDDLLEHGFDHQSVLRTLDGTLLVYGDGWIDELHWNHYEGVMLTRYELDENGVARSSHQILKGYYTLTEHVQVDNKLTYSIKRSPEHRDGTWSVDSSLVWYEYKYDESGLLDHVLRQDLREDGVFFSSPWFVRPRGEDVASASLGFQEALVDAFKDIIRQYKQDDPLSLLWITYCGEDISIGFPSDFHYLCESALSRLMTDKMNLSYNCWRSGIEVAPDREHRTALDLASVRLLQRCDYEEELNSDYYTADGLRNALHAACQQLNADLDAINSKLAPGFVVCATDATGDYDEDDDVKKCVSKDQFKHLSDVGIVD
tara:strand:+ start:109583 stop:111013 length:1431 start_codon:yes stop_codon:yes gene_type:complete